jgi:hypothetical protein
LTLIGRWSSRRARAHACARLSSASSPSSTRSLTRQDGGDCRARCASRPLHPRHRSLHPGARSPACAPRSCLASCRVRAHPPDLRARLRAASPPLPSPPRRKQAFRLSSPRLASSGDGVATRVARVVRRPRRSQGVRRCMPRCRGGAWTSSGLRAVTSRGSRRSVLGVCVSDSECLVKGAASLGQGVVYRVHPPRLVRRGVSCRFCSPN